MADKLEFRSKLGEVLALAISNENKITSEQVEQYFEEDHLSHEQLELVFDYLLAQKVAVKGYVKQGGRVSEGQEAPEDGNEILPLTVEEEAYLTEYLTDLEALRDEKEGELSSLYEQVKEGNSSAKSRVTELYLKKVVQIGKELNHPEIFLGDIIQEGNVSLMVALEDVTSWEVGESHAIEAYLEGEIRQGIQMLIEETTDLKSRDQNMVEKVEVLDESITKLTEDLGRKVTIEELSLYLELPEEEILEILKLTGEEVEEIEDENKTDIRAKDLGIHVIDENKEA